MVRGGRRFRSRKGQVAIEYVMMMGFSLLLLIPLIVVYYTQANQLGDETTSASINRAAKQIVETADTVYYLGSPSTRTITVDIPENVESVVVEGQRVGFMIESSHGAYVQNAWSVANLTGSFGISAGPHILVVTALADNRVNITER